MLEEKIKSVYKGNYGIEIGNEPRFDEIFNPNQIASLPESMFFHNAENKFEAYRGLVDKINERILNHKKLNNGKKDFVSLFAKNYMLFNIFDLLPGFERGYSYILKDLAVSEYDVGHELVEQDRPFAINFLNKSCTDMMLFKNNLEKTGYKDSYIMSVLAGAYLEINFYLLKCKNSSTDEKVKNIINGSNLAIEKFYQSLKINKIQNSDKTRRFQGYFAKRFYHFVAFAKHELKATENGYDCYKELVNYEYQLFEDLGLPYPQHKNETFASQ